MEKKFLEHVFPEWKASAKYVAIQDLISGIPELKKSGLNLDRCNFNDITNYIARNGGRNMAHRYNQIIKYLDNRMQDTYKESLSETRLKVFPSEIYKIHIESDSRIIPIQKVEKAKRSLVNKFDFLKNNNVNPNTDLLLMRKLIEDKGDVLFAKKYNEIAGNEIADFVEPFFWKEGWEIITSLEGNKKPMLEISKMKTSLMKQLSLVKEQADEGYFDRDIETNDLEKIKQILISYGDQKQIEMHNKIVEEFIGNNLFWKEKYILEEKN